MFLLSGCHSTEYTCILTYSSINPVNWKYKDNSKLIMDSSRSAQRIGFFMFFKEALRLFKVCLNKNGSSSHNTSLKTEYDLTVHSSHYNYVILV